MGARSPAATRDGSPHHRSGVTLSKRIPTKRAQSSHIYGGLGLALGLGLGFKV